MPLTLPVSTVVECLRTVCYILGDNKNMYMLDKSGLLVKEF